MTLKWKRANKTETTNNRNRAIWLVYQTDTNTHGFWLVKWILGWRNFTPKELSRIQSILCFGFILQHDWLIEQCLLQVRVFFGGKTKRPWFDLFIHWLIRQTTNTYRNHFSRSYENCSTVSVISTYLFKSYNAHQSTQSSHISMWKIKECKKLVNLQDTIK